MGEVAAHIGERKGEDEEHESESREFIIDNQGNASGNEEFGAIERRDRDEVEQREVDAEAGSAGGEFAQVGVDLAGEGGERREDYGQEDIADGPGEGDDGEAVQVETKTSGVGVDGASPTDESTAEQGSDGGKDDCAEEIDVGRGIEGEAPFPFRCVIAEANGCPGVRELMRHGEDDQQADVDEGSFEIEGQL